MSSRCGPIPLKISLPSSTLLKLRKREPHKVIFQSTFNLCSYILLYAFAVGIGRPWAWIVAWWFQGFILSGFLGAAHDCAHGTFAGSPRINHIAGALWSSVVLFNFSLYKYFHLEHHRHTSVAGDTEPSGTFPSIWSYLANLPTTAFFVSFWKMSIQAALGSFPHFVRSSASRRAVRQDNLVQLAWVLLAVTLTAIFPETVLKLYWLPMLFYFPMVFWTSLPEHYGCAEGPDMLSNTRTTTSNALFRYVFWNGNFHAEHHVYPGIPSHNLLKLHDLIGRSFEFREKSYLAFHGRLVRDLVNARGSIPTGKPLDPMNRVEYSLYKDCQTTSGDNA